jgi:transcriptional regulator with XRE-family HTH domain
MAEVVSPTVARRRVRLALREAREAAGRTQLEVAEEMEWSLSKVIRIENGDVSISPNDLRPLLTYLGVKDRTRINALVAAAKVARSRQHISWWQAPEFRALTGELRQYIEYEAVAVAVYSFAIRYVSGPLQTPEYAEALTGSFDIELEETQANVVVKARQLRRDALLSRLGEIKFRAVYDESVFMRPIGGPAVFAGQLRDLHRLASEGLVQLRMLPFSLTAPIANNASFDLLSLSDEEDAAGNEVLYRENGLIDELIEDASSTRRHLDRFRQLWNVATNETDTIAYIGRRIEALENHQGQ